MSQSVNVNGSTYLIPDVGENDWGQNVTDWAVALSGSSLQLKGGAFSLTAEADFGGSFGLKSLYFKSRTADAAAAGQVRLARTDSVSWRNVANSADLALTVDGSNQLTFNGSVLATGGLGGSGTSGKVPKFTGSNTLGDGILSDDGTNVSLGASQSFLGTKTGNTAGLQYSFVGDTDTGLGATSFMGADNSMYLICGGVYMSDMSSVTGMTVRGAKLNTLGNTVVAQIVDNGASPHQFVTTQVGSVTFPSFGYSGDVNTGIHFPGLDIMGFVGGGIEVARVTTQSSNPQFEVADGSDASPAISFIGDQNTGFTWSAADNFKALAGGATVCRFYYSGSAAQLTAGLGSAANPSFAMAATAGGTTGMFGATDKVAITLSATERFSVEDDAGTVVARLPDGSATKPGIQFTLDTNTGFYRVTTDEIGVSAAGAKQLAFLSGFCFQTVGGNESTGAGSALLGANSPAGTLTAPYTWIKVKTSDNSTAYIPVWK